MYIDWLRMLSLASMLQRVPETASRNLSENCSIPSRIFGSYQPDKKVAKRPTRASKRFRTHCSDTHAASRHGTERSIGYMHLRAKIAAICARMLTMRKNGGNLAISQSRFPFHHAVRCGIVTEVGYDALLVRYSSVRGEPRRALLP